MRTKSILLQDEIQEIINTARLEAESNNWKVAISVVDDGGHPLAFLRLDDTSPISAYIATEKAKSAALGRRETKAYEDMVNGGRSAFISAPLLTSLEGGVPIVVNGHVVGAIGVSGVKPDQDAQIAMAGANSINNA